MKRKVTQLTSFIMLKRKIIFSVFLTAFFAINFAETNAQVNVNLPGEKFVCSIGDNVIVPINVSDFTNVSAFSLKIQYDPAVLSFIETQNWSSEVTISEMVEGNNSTTGIYSVSWLDLTTVDITNGLLFELKFEYLGGTTAFNFLDSEIADSNGDPIVCTFTSSGSVQIPPSVEIVGSEKYM
jgi:hypothetical protein